MTWLPLFRRVFVVAGLFGCFTLLLHPVAAETRLTIGLDAPELDISDWLQETDDSTKSEVTKFEKGQIYVVEFWATWCGPCIQSMPYLAQLQRKYSDKGVRVISVSEEDIPTVKEFLSRETKTRDGSVVTFQELTKSYSLTTDPDGSTHRDYTTAANIRGIPVAFIVGKDSKIEWIGHPLSMDKPLEQVIEGTWDRNSFAIEYEEEKRFEDLQESISMRLESLNGREPSAKLVTAIIASVETFLEGTKTPAILKKLHDLQFDLLLQFKPDAPETITSYEAKLGSLKRRPLEANGLNWGVYELAKAGHISNRDFVVIALDKSKKLVEQVPAEQVGTVYDTISHLQYFLGDLPAALDAAKLAAEAPDATPDFAAFVLKLEMEISEVKAKEGR